MSRYMDVGSGAVFKLTSEHVKLLRSAYVGWQDCETGAPEINPKRPYGNSSVALDVMEILGWPIEEENEEACERAMQLHYETEIALQIVLSTGSFEPGVYRTGGDSRWSAYPAAEPAPSERATSVSVEQLVRERDQAALDFATQTLDLAATFMDLAATFKRADDALKQAVGGLPDDQEAP